MKVIMKGILLPDNTSITSPYELVNIILTHKDTTIQYMNDDASSYGLIIILKISDYLQNKLGIFTFDETHILNNPLQKLTTFLLKIVHLSANTNDYCFYSHNQKRIKYSQSIQQYNNEIFMQNKIFHIGLQYNKILCPELLFHNIFSNKLDIKNIFHKLTSLKPKLHIYNNVFQRLLTYFFSPKFIKSILCNQKSYKGIGISFMKYYSNYESVYTLYRDRKLFHNEQEIDQFSNIIYKQLYILKQHNIAHGDLHPGNYIWNPQKNYGIFIDFARTNINRNISLHTYNMNTFISDDTCNCDIWLLKLNKYKQQKNMELHYNNRISLDEIYEKMEGYLAINELDHR